MQSVTRRFVFEYLTAIGWSGVLSCVGYVIEIKNSHSFEVILDLVFRFCDNVGQWTTQESPTWSNKEFYVNVCISG